MAETPLAKKLGLKAGQRALFWHAPSGYRDLLGTLPTGVTVAERPDGLYDHVHLFVRSKAEIDALAGEAIAATRPDGLRWISYPKRSSKVPTDVTRDAGWEAVEGVGWLGVRQVAVDAVWSSLRFRPVGSIPRLTRGGMGGGRSKGDR